MAQTHRESIEELDTYIALVRDNLRELVESSSGYSGAGDEELLSRRIADQEAELDRLMERRAALSSGR